MLDFHWCLQASVPGRVGLSRLALRATAQSAAAALTARLMRPGKSSPSTNGQSGLGEALCAARQANRSLPVIDTLIAATAIRHGLTLVTRNIRDVESTGVPLVDPRQIR